MMNQSNAKIARTWHGAVPEEHADAYYNYLLQTGLADYKSIEGNCGVYVLRRSEKQKGEVHFLLITLWDSYQSIKEFADEPINKARYYPKDKEYLLTLNPFVKHYEFLQIAK
ncbi:hypothetical protein [Fodinibius salsisoli]|uniref:Antibiotic biosynthesis monooxygenase n=1 Tax=Fodinibius salsisoli TaxID=2820877 RepID=A0ABT3PI87_9BACT|nr:hypothetical protein [Fodinibius salsisoli]MCW9705645.1 hypothetical protein [Fodinibius salsisoli]